MRLSRIVLRLRADWELYRKTLSAHTGKCTASWNSPDPPCLIDDESAARVLDVTREPILPLWGPAINQV